MLNMNGSKDNCVPRLRVPTEIAPSADTTDVSQTIAERESTHGPYAPKCATIQALKRTMHTAPNWERLSDAQRESLDLIATKVGRILHGDPDHYDSWHDIAGYARLVARELES